MLKKIQLSEEDKKLLLLFQADCRFLEFWTEKTLKRKKIDANDLLRLSEGAKTCSRTIEKTQAFRELGLLQEIDND